MNDQTVAEMLDTLQEGYLTRANCFVAWSLAPPPHNFGEWALVSVTERVTDDGIVPCLVHQRALSQSEIDEIVGKTDCLRGIKIKDEPWALVTGKLLPISRVAARRVITSGAVVDDDPLKRTGV